MEGVTDSILVCLGQLGGDLYKRVTDRPLSAACPWARLGTNFPDCAYL